MNSLMEFWTDSCFDNIDDLSEVVKQDPAPQLIVEPHVVPNLKTEEDAFGRYDDSDRFDLPVRKHSSFDLPTINLNLNPNLNLNLCIDPASNDTLYSLDASSTSDSLSCASTSASSPPFSSMQSLKPVNERARSLSFTYTFKQADMAMPHSQPSPYVPYATDLNPVTNMNSYYQSPQPTLLTPVLPPPLQLQPTVQQLPQQFICTGVNCTYPNCPGNQGSAYNSAVYPANSNSASAVVGTASSVTSAGQLTSLPKADAKVPSPSESCKLSCCDGEVPCWKEEVVGSGAVRYSAHSSSCPVPPPISLSAVHSSATMHVYQSAKIGMYTPEARRRRIARFLEKRSRRVWDKKISYDCRKKLADTRPRIKGRFVKKEEAQLILSMLAK